MEQGQPIENHTIIDLLNQLKKMTLQIPLLDAIKEVPTYTKVIKEACIKKIGRRIQTKIHFVGHLSDLMLDKLTMPKYYNPRSPMVTVTVNGMKVQNALVDLGESIKIMKKDVLSRFHIIGLRETPTILLLVDSSTIKMDGMMKYVIVTLKS